MLLRKTKFQKNEKMSEDKDKKKIEKPYWNESSNICVVDLSFPYLRVVCQVIFQCIPSSPL